jgi:hypothetical protein
MNERRLGPRELQLRALREANAEKREKGARAIAKLLSDVAEVKPRMQAKAVAKAAKKKKAKAAKKGARR